MQRVSMTIQASSNGFGRSQEKPGETVEAVVRRQKEREREIYIKEGEILKATALE